MSKKIRYFLIVLGCLFFLTAAPLIVFFVRGLKFDFKEKKFIATGILAMESDPKDAEVYLDGKLVRTSQGEIRFLEPRDYRVSLKKNGYRPWEKILTIEADKVSRISPQGNKINLLLNSQTAQNLAEKIVDFEIWGSGLLVLTQKTLLIGDSPDLQTAQSLDLPKTATKIQASQDHKYFLLTEEPANETPAHVLLYDRVSHQLSDLKSLFETTKASLPIFAFGPEGQIFALLEGKIYLINAKNSSRQLLISAVNAFTIQGQTLYYVAQEKNSLALLAYDLETAKKTTLLEGLPEFKKSEILTNSQKRIFLVADKSIYRVGADGLIKLAENLSAWNMKEFGESLSFVAGGEFWYAGASGNAVLVTRTSESLKLPLAKPTLGYALYVERQKLMAWELDHQGQPNSYELYSGSNIQKYQLNEDSRELLMLDDGMLKLLKIR